MTTTFVLKQAVDELKETNNFNLRKHHQLHYQSIKFDSRNVACYFFFFFFDDESVLKPMQWQNYGKFLIQPQFHILYCITKLSIQYLLVFLESSQNAQENTSARVSILIKGVLAQMFSCKLCEIFKYTFHKTPLVVASILCRNSFLFLLYYFF